MNREMEIKNKTERKLKRHEFTATMFVSLFPLVHTGKHTCLCVVLIIFVTLDGFEMSIFGKKMMNTENRKKKHSNNNTTLTA